MNDRWQSKQGREPGVNRTSDFHHQLCICERLCVFLAKIKKHLTEVKSNRAQAILPKAIIDAAVDVQIDFPRSPEETLLDLSLQPNVLTSVGE